MKRKTGGKLLSVLLTLAMLAGLLPGMSLTARAAEPAICTVTFDSDGGSAVAAQTVETGGKAAKPADPALTGSHFLGWFVNPTLESIYTEDFRLNTFDFEQPVTGNVTLKALWVAPLYVNARYGGKIDVVIPGQEPSNSAQVNTVRGLFDTFTVVAQPDKGYRFVKWQKEVGEDEYEDYGTDARFTLTVTEELSLIALFEPAAYDVTGHVTVLTAGGGSDKVQGAEVTLQGTDINYLPHSVSVVSDENGNYTITGVRCGQYKLTVSDSDRSKTEYFELEDSDRTVDVVLPLYQVSSAVVNQWWTDVVVAGLDDAAADSLTDEEKTDDVTTKVTMTIETSDLTDVPDTDLDDTQRQKKAEQQAIQNADPSVRLDFLDMSIVKTTQKTGEAARNVDVHETQRVLEILLPQYTAGYVFRIYRYHDQQPEAFTRLTARPTDNFKDATFYVGDGFIALYTNRFSTYAIGMIPCVAVAFDANGGTGTMADQTVQGTAELNANAFTRGGYAFAGWNTNADGSGTGYTDRQSVSPSSDLTLYAQWSRISYDSPSGSDDSSDSTTYRHTVNTPSGGTVSASPDAARNGETVTITVRPDTGYAADTVTVTGTNGRSVAVKKVNDVTYTYNQPGMDVTVNAAFRATGGAETPAAFSDVSASDWYAGAVRWALDNGVMNGVGDGRFDPNGDTSRAMVVTMLWRLEGSPAYAGASEFADVKSEDWYGQAVRWASAEGIVTGYEQDGSKVFNPNGAVKREQLAAMLYRYAQHKGQGFTGLWAFPLDYPDASSVSDWAYEAMCWMTMNGVINGMDGALAPASGASRAQVATMLMRYCENR